MLGMVLNAVIGRNSSSLKVTWPETISFCSSTGFQIY
jgi:hypothetical protein